MHKKYAWQAALANCVTDPRELLDILELDPKLLPAAQAAALQFPLKITRSFLARIQKGRLDDPLLRQILPLDAENQFAEGYVADALQEKAANPVTGVLHKYHGRLLVTLSGACAINCRYCFRRHFPYSENIPQRKNNFAELITYIRDHADIREVILSGGDPLVANDSYLQQFSDALQSLPQIKTLRIHTRIPVVLPERVTAAFLNWLSDLQLRKVMVLHINHAQEMDAQVSAMLSEIRKTNAQLLNQSVLLKGINDDASTLITLSEALFSAGVLPYYLHMPDKVAGTAHFDVSTDTAHELHQAMTEHLPGYLVPKLVVEIPGAKSKMTIITSPLVGEVGVRSTTGEGC